MTLFSKLAVEPGHRHVSDAKSIHADRLLRKRIDDPLHMKTQAT